MKYAPRLYRDLDDNPRWTSFSVKVETTDIHFRARTDLRVEAERLVRALREDLRAHIARHNGFHTALSPLPMPDDAPPVAAAMYRAAERAGVGPMAAVAGAVAEFTGRALSDLSPEIVVENGGDIWLALSRPAVVGLLSENIYFRDGLSLVIRPGQTPCGVCSSSASTGPSLSFGRADAVTVIARDAALADALATAACNLVRDEQGLAAAVDFAVKQGAEGAIAVFRDTMAARGAIELADPGRVTDGAYA